MIYRTVFFFIIISVQSSFASPPSVFTSTVHSIDLGRKKTEPHIIKFNSGRVAFIKKGDVDLLDALEESRKNRLIIEIVQDKKNNIIAAQDQGIEKDEEEDYAETSLNQTPSYEPTVLTDYNSALSILKEMRKDYNKDGQCYSRAHVWAYEEYNRSGLQSMKLFLFFTNRYIRNYRFHWWFHVTPMTYVGGTMRTLDRRYSSAPLRTKTWTDIFIKSKRSCRLVKYYNTYANHQESQDCYLIPVSMYFLIPRDIERRDLLGKVKESFIQRDIDRSYRDAFNM